MTVEDCAEARDWSLECIREGFSFKAIDSSNGNIIGIVMNDVWHKTDTDRRSNGLAESLKNEKLKIIVTFCEHIENQVDLFELYPGYDRAMYVNKLSVDTTYRNLGIGRQLLNRTFELMQELDIKISQILVTNEYLIRLCLKMDYIVLHEIPFDSYVAKGVKPLIPARPHTAAKILVKIIK